MVSGEKIYKLQKSIKYSHEGDPNKEGSFIELKEPTAQHSKYYFKLKQMINRAALEMTSKSAMFGKPDEHRGQHFGTEVIPESQKDEATVKAEDDDALMIVKMSMELSEKEDMGVFVDNFRSLAIKQNVEPICLVDGVAPMTAVYFDRLSLDDQFELACTWCSFFAKALTSLMSNESGQQ